MFERKNDIDRIDVSIGIYVITGVSLLAYIFWIFLDDTYELACVTIIIDLVWYNYSRRLFRINNECDYTKSYTVNYMVCVFGCFSMYNFEMPMLYRNVCIVFVSCEGFARTFFCEIRKLIKESKGLESQVDE